MGLDLFPEACAKPGHEAEWRRAIERSFDNVAFDDQEQARFEAISIPPYADLGAPRVGEDPAADAWILKQRNAVGPEEIAAVLEEFRGLYVLKLVACDGTPRNSHGGRYGGLDETSFRGEILAACGDVLDKTLIDSAWENRLPEHAVSYGQVLLAAADAAEARGGQPKPALRTGLFAKLLAKKPRYEPIPFEEQIEIVREAGRWFVFWGERGHPIRAWS